MLKDIVGVVLSVIMSVLLLVVSPMYYIGVIEWARSESEALAYTRNVIDEVIDTRELTDDMLADYNLNMASLSEYYTIEITRKVKVINPDPVHAGQTYTTYMIVDDNRHYNQGDIIIVDVKQIGSNTFQMLARGLMGMTILKDDITLCGRVR